MARSNQMLTFQVRPYSQLNCKCCSECSDKLICMVDREILQEILSWESIDFKREVAVADESQEDNLQRLNNKYDLYIKEKENTNQELHNALKLLQAVPAKNKKAQAQSMDSLPAPDPCLPPLQKIKNEPFGDNTVMKFEGDDVLDTFNEFADSTLEFGSSLLKRLIKAEAFSGITYSNSTNPD